MVTSVWPFKRAASNDNSRQTAEGEGVRISLRTERPKGSTATPDWEFDMAVPIPEIAALYLSHVWEIDMGHRIGCPTPAEILLMIAREVEKLEGNEDIEWLETRRMMFLRDDQDGGDTHVYLYLGTTRRPNPDNFDDPWAEDD